MNNSYYPIAQELRTTDRGLYGAGSVNVNNTIYIYGGFYKVSLWNKEAMWTWTDHLKQIITDPYASPAVIYSSLQAANDTLFAFGGHLDEIDIETATNGTLPVEPLRYYAFSLKKIAWTPLQKTISDVSPLERFWHSTVKSGDQVYLFGGMNITHGMTDFWQYHINTNSWTELILNTKTRCGHTSTITNDGKIINLGGFDCSMSSFIKPASRNIFLLDSASIYDTKQNKWYEQSLSGDIPKPRIFHSAVQTNDNRIVICGGQNQDMEPFQIYLSESNQKDMTAILNLENWYWTQPEPSHFQPSPRSHAVGNIINETIMVYGFGLNYHTVYDGVYLFNLTSNTWIPPTIDVAPTTMSSFILWSIMLSIGLLIVALPFIFKWLYKKKVAIDFDGISLTLKKIVWDPRAGEPLWAELHRFIFRFLFSVIYIVLGIVLLLQVEHSPIIDQHHDHHELSMVTPDIRFCFDGWETPLLQCVTDFGEACSQHIINITQQIDGRVFHLGKHLDCYLFRSEIKLGETQNRVRFDGSSLRFSYYGTPSRDASVRIELYPPQHDPNLPVYGIQGDFDGWYDQDESSKFESMDQMNLKTEDVFDIALGLIHRIAYRFVERQKVASDVWNYVGLGKSHLRLEFSVQSLLVDSRPFRLLPHLNLKPQGMVQIYPLDYHRSIIKEQRVFTLIHGVGMIGGIVGLLVGLQVSLFGYRPRSPWGFFHRWSNKQVIQKSLLNGLKSKLPEMDAVCPFPPSENKALEKIEEKLNTFELVFQAYYIDDEIFRSLHQKK